MSKLVIDNMSEVLFAAKLKKRGWARDYEAEPWIEDKKEWWRSKRAELAPERAAARAERHKEDTKRFKKQSFKRWRKRK